MANQLESLLRITAIPMKTPEPYSAFHLFWTAIGVFAAYMAAQKLSRSRGDTSVLFTCSLLLAASELWKQGFLYFIVNDHTYDWWYFPFQLCSLPMYLGLFLPLCPLLPWKNSEKCLCAFIQDYGLLGGVMALAEPSGLFHEWLPLTFHGLIWHFILIFMGLYCAMSGLAGRCLKDFIPQIWLLLLFSLIATAINILSHPWGNADMFYISPYYPNGQILFHQIALKIGITAGNLIYLSGVMAGGFLIHLLISLI